MKTNKIEVFLLSSHDLVEKVDASMIDNVFVGKPTDEDLISVILINGRKIFCDELKFIKHETSKCT